MTNEVAKVNGEVSTTVEAWGVAESTDVNDILIPRAVLVQKTSKVMDMPGVNARPGEYRDSVDGTLLGNAEKPIEVMMFDTFKNWVVTDPEDGNKFVRCDSWKPGEDSREGGLPWLFVEDGRQLKRTLSRNFYCLVVSPNILVNPPYVISFASTASKAAKHIHTLFSRLKRLGRPSASAVLRITTEQRKDGDRSWYVPVVDVSRDGTPDEVELAKMWYSDIRGGAVKVQVHEPSDEDSAIDVTPETNLGGTVTFELGDDSDSIPF